MDDVATVDVPVHELIRTRWSPRAFADTPVDEKALRTLFEAARWAASCFNDQPWYFVVAEKKHPDEFGRLLQCLAASNQRWAHTAPVLMITVARVNFAHHGKPNRHAYHDVGAAMAQFTLQAASMGLFVHQMAGFDMTLARETLQIPNGFEPVAAVALGYVGDPSQLPDDLREREQSRSSRRPATECVFSGVWGKTRFDR